MDIRVWKGLYDSWSLGSTVGLVVELSQQCTGEWNDPHHKLVYIYVFITIIVTIVLQDISDYATTTQTIHNI